MKASSYPVLKDRPIDQWKVTELREELKRRKLTTKGLKEDLVRRLDESLRDEIETAVEGDAANGNGDDDSQLKDQDEEPILVADESVSKDDEVGKGDTVTENVEGNADARVTQDDGLSAQAIDNAGVKNANQNSAQQVDDSSSVKDELATDTPSVEISIAASDDASNAALAVEVSKREQIETEKSDSKIQDIEPPVVEISTVSENLPSETSSAMDVLKKEPVGTEKSDSTAQPNAEDIKPLGESVTDAPSVEINIAASEKVLSEAAPAVEVSVKEEIATDKSNTGTEPAEDIKPPDEEVKHVMSDLNHQVSEVSPSLGFPVKHDSISDDSMTNNEKNELKDNIIADDVKLEPDVKHEIVQPSSSPVALDAGKSHPMDVEEPRNKHSDDETNKTVVDVDISKKNSSADLGSPEKLNLDRSSGDDSMEEDTLESKQVDSTCNSDEVGGRGEKNDVTLSKEESLVDVVGNDSAAKKDSHVDDMVVAASADKRKLPEQETIASNEPSKRQRRWKTETVKVSEPQSPIPPVSTTPKGTPHAAGGLKRSFSRSNSDAAGDDAPKERVVPPPLKPATDSLRIDNFLRPFTLKAVQELLGKTGTVTNFWMDHIKTHCYVTYSSLEEAVETRNAVYNLKWPPNGGRNLAAEFVDAQEVKSRVEGPTQPAPAPPAVAPPAEPVAVPPQPSPRQLGLRQKLPPPANLPPPPPLANPPPVRERLQPPPPPPLMEKVEPPALTLDDLFKKTKATPRIYYLPLSEEQVKAKMEVQQGKQQ